VTEINVIAHDLRSAHNVGSLLRTADGLGVSRVYLTGYTPYPVIPNDTRLPHVSRRLTSRIHKTALGAEEYLDIEQSNDLEGVINKLRLDGYVIAGLEQSKGSITLNELAVPPKIAIILGNEVSGLEPEILTLADHIIEIPMFGQKESFNVIEAASMALFYCRFF
jgi:23S rRNA (guanosine2251-2'-O)-methyltransferase